MKDLTFDGNFGKFNVRVAVLVEHNDRLLTQNEGESYWLIGGRAHFGEDSKQAILREIAEELCYVPSEKDKLSLNFIPASSEKVEEEIVANEQYTVQSGDTMEAILVRFYGSYSKEKEALVLKTNNLTNPNKLSIGQKLIIPMEEPAQ